MFRKCFLSLSLFFSIFYFSFRKLYAQEIQKQKPKNLEMNNYREPGTAFFLELFGKPSSSINIDFRIDESIRFSLGIMHYFYETRDEEEGEYDDVIYFGSNVETVESLFGRVANNALINIVLCGGQLAREAVLPVGKVHYQGIRIVGTTGSDPADSMKTIPAAGEFREGDVIDVVGAGGPMGVMHVVRGLCQGVAGVKVLGGDLDDQRLAMLDKIAKGPAERNGVPYESYNPLKGPAAEKGTYIVIMAPVPKLVAAAVQNGAAGAIINIFAGIPATVEGQVDLQSYIEKGMYFIGTSGSSLEDMKTMLAKVQTGQIDTNVSVAAIGGLDGAIEGIRAIEKQLVPGKILIYPACRGLGLVPLEKLEAELPEVASMLVDGMWTLAAEDKLLEVYS